MLKLGWQKASLWLREWSEFQLWALKERKGGITGAGNAKGSDTQQKRLWNLQNFTYQVEVDHFCSPLDSYIYICIFSTQLDIASFMSLTEISGVSSGCQQGGCLTCSDYNGCLSCKPRFFMHLERIGMKQIGVCMTSCPPGFYGTRFPERSPCTSKRFVWSFFFFFKVSVYESISSHRMCKCMAVNISPICVTVLWSWTCPESF